MFSRDFHKSGAQKKTPAYLPQTLLKKQEGGQRKATLLTKTGGQRWSRAPPYLRLLQAGSAALSFAWNYRARYRLPSSLCGPRPLMRKAAVAELLQQSAPAQSSQGSAHHQSSNRSRSHGNHRSFLLEKEGRGGATVKRAGYSITWRPAARGSDHNFKPIHSRLQILKVELRGFRHLICWARDQDYKPW